jgi:hypothetical protein
LWIARAQWTRVIKWKEQHRLPTVPRAIAKTS